MSRSVRPAVHPDSWGSGLSVCWLGRGPMAYTDSLFQLGMDLTRSSTAQKEDHGQSAHGAHDDRKDYFIERDGHRYAGTHLIIDLFGAKRLDDLKHIKETLKRCVEVADSPPVPYPPPSPTPHRRALWRRRVRGRRNHHT